MDKHARILFSLAAAYNFAAGLPMLFAMPQFAALTGMTPAHPDPVFVHLSAVLVLVFGWGYWRIGRDPVFNRPIIHMGLVGKSCVVVAGYADWLLGNVNWPFAALISGDLVFALLFYDYLRRRPR